MLDKRKFQGEICCGSHLAITYIEVSLCMFMSDPRKFKREICCGGHLAVTYMENSHCTSVFFCFFLFFVIFVANPAKQFHFIRVLPFSRGLKSCTHLCYHAVTTHSNDICTDSTEWSHKIWKYNNSTSIRDHQNGRRPIALTQARGQKETRFSPLNSLVRS